MFIPDSDDSDADSSMNAMKETPKKEWLKSIINGKKKCDIEDCLVLQGPYFSYKKIKSER